MKDEPLTQREAKALELEQFYVDLDSKIDACQDMELEAKKMMAAQADLKKTNSKQFQYTEGLATDLTTHCALVGKLQNILKRLIVVKPDETKVPALIKQFDGLMASHLALKDVAKKFGLVVVNTRKRKARTA